MLMALIHYQVYMLQYLPESPCARVRNPCGSLELLRQACDNYTVLYWGSFKPRSIISYLSMCWRRAERSRVKSLDTNGPSLWSLRHDGVLTKALPGHRASWLSLSSSTCLQLIFLISCSSVCPVLAQINLGFADPSCTEACSFVPYGHERFTNEEHVTDK